MEHAGSGLDSWTRPLNRPGWVCAGGLRFYWLPVEPRSIQQPGEPAVLAFEFVQQAVVVLNAPHGVHDEVNAQNDKSEVQHDERYHQVQHRKNVVGLRSGDEDTQHGNRQGKHSDPRA